MKKSFWEPLYHYNILTDRKKDKLILFPEYIYQREKMIFMMFFYN